MEKPGRQVLQKKVDSLFLTGTKLPSHKPFHEFRDKDIHEMKQFLLQLHDTANKETKNESAAVNAVLKLCTDCITVKNLNPALVKKALGIFLTHDPKAQQAGAVVPPLKKLREKPVEIRPQISPVTADTMTGYDIISYFREDHDINDHHWHWHMVYPYSGVPVDGKHVRALDRQGELFLYMHSQMLARYNAELVSWNLDIAHAWSYNDVATFSYTPPPSLQDEYSVRPRHRGWHYEGDPSTSEMDTWRNNILKAIEMQTLHTVKADGKPGVLQLTGENAMNWIGIISEAETKDLQEVKPESGEFIDRNLYGNLHNSGHNKFSQITYPGVENMGVMGSTKAAVRDPVFWLWHRHIDDFRLAIIKKYDHDVNKYKPDVNITDLKIVPRESNSKTPAGGLTTILGPPQLHLDESTAKIDHEPYKWELKVESTRNVPPSESNPQFFTVRLFIVPKDFIRDERSWIEMDKFTYELTALTGTIVRLDIESSVARKTPKPGEELSSRCLCGWPQNMMLPAGKPEGMVYTALAMLTDDKLDKGGTKAISFCGSKDRIYPDHRGMGYPFDKKWSNIPGQDTILYELMVAKDPNYPHIKVQDFAIYRTTKKEIDTQKD